jgi:hypothetical protein
MSRQTISSALLVITLAACGGPSDNTDAKTTTTTFDRSTTTAAVAHVSDECLADHRDAVRRNEVIAYLPTVQSCTRIDEWVAALHETDGKFDSDNFAAVIDNICSLGDANIYTVPLCAEARAG